MKKENLKKILSIKYIENIKYYKNNYWSIAHFESWANQGKAGGCNFCKNKSYQYTLRNKRKKLDILQKVCSECFDQIQESSNTNFTKHYCR